MIDAEREALSELYRAGEIDDEARRRAIRDLDLQEARRA
jgi:hypothetical protein